MPNFVEIHLKGDKIEFINHGGYETRNESIINLSTLAFEKMDNKKIFKNILVFTEDCPVYIYDENILKNYEVYNQSDIKENFDKIFPDFVFDHWKQVGIYDYDKVCKELEKYGENNFEIDKLFWIGAITHPNRKIFLDKFKNNENILAIVNNWKNSENKDPTQQLSGTNFISLNDHTKFRYLIDLEGNGYSGRIKILTHMNRLLIIQDRPFWDWASCLLEDGKHYIKVNRDFSNFEEIFKKVKENPEKFENMRKDCFEFSKQNFTKEKAIERIINIFKK